MWDGVDRRAEGDSPHDRLEIYQQGAQDIHSYRQVIHTQGGANRGVIPHLDWTISASGVSGEG